ncbi:hypothetical protein [Tenacibaculum sp. M341]|uniref:hypothetical protein n=1 Tax=Tenacibaculum sp. M341 TaxID=2530339 RepID=UPI0010507FE1|nr:hypothetical protein [Tenacibaculum sp. M341]TCI90023.1 hypothetical protein EYW44_15265 [Tenacibaculum sp. M341]
MNRKLLLYLFDKLLIIIALVILFDFLVPGKTYHEEIVGISQQKQQYYNAARNSHNTYKVSTENRNFHVSKQFALKAKKSDQIIYKTSKLFNEVNNYKLTELNYKETYSLRFLTGLIIPIISLIALYFFKDRNHTVKYICQLFLIADFIFLVFI